MMKIAFGKPLIGPEEKNAVMEVLEQPILVHGPKADEFEKSFQDYTKAPFAISVSSCTAGMHLVYFALGLRDGDEVIVPAQTHVATAHAVELTGAKAVFVDCEIDTGNIDIDKIEQKITHKTKAIAVVHYLGVPVDMPKVAKIVKKHNLFLLEDCALAPGTKLNQIHAGLFGDVGVFSFYPVKHFTTAEGGMIIVKSEEFAEKLRHLKAFGIDKNHGERRIPGFYDAISLGFNYRMSEIHAAIGIEQLKKLDKFLKIRKTNFQHLSKNLENINMIKILPQPSDIICESSFYCMGILLSENIAFKRSLLIENLGKKGIGTSVYYPQPVPRMTYYAKKYGYDSLNFRNAEIISDGIICLPVAPHLKTSDMDFISEVLIKELDNLDVKSRKN